MNEITLDEIQRRTPSGLECVITTTATRRVFCVIRTTRPTVDVPRFDFSILRSTPRDAFETALSVAQAFVQAINQGAG